MKNNAIGLLHSWLSACGIEHDVSRDAVSIKAANGERVEVQASEVDPHQILSTDLDISLSEFHKITERTGYGKPVPVSRGKAPKKRMNKDPLLARWRHSEMRTVPNASTEDLMQYEDIAAREARIFVARNKNLCAEMGYDQGTAHNDALVWINTYLGRYQVFGTDDDMDTNRRLITAHVRQRFGEMAVGLYRQLKTVNPDPSYAEYVAGLTSEDPDPEWKEAHDEIGYRAPKFRRRRAKELLDEGFAAMGHDKMITTLKQVAESHPCYDTRKAASAKLEEHRTSCGCC